MAKIMQEIYRAARDARKPHAERRRYSSLVCDPGHQNYIDARLRGKVVIVRLDGRVIDAVITADEVQGFVLCCELPIRIEADGSDVVKVTRRGVVGCDEVEP